jgi:hypothetical protein
MLHMLRVCVVLHMLRVCAMLRVCNMCIVCNMCTMLHMVNMVSLRSSGRGCCLLLPSEPDCLLLSVDRRPRARKGCHGPRVPWRRAASQPHGRARGRHRN